jgi:dephospho-CoA kinase
MKIIGLTGGIASGKSTVASLLKKLGAEVMDADRLGHEIYLPGAPAYIDVVKEFSRDILNADGTINRAKLGKLVFTNPQALDSLNRITHPRITALCKQKIEENRAKNTKVMVVEATLLVEDGWKPLVDEVWTVAVSPQIAVQRLKIRSGYSESEALSRIRSQSTNDRRAATADVIIENNGSPQELETEVNRLWTARIVI